MPTHTKIPYSISLFFPAYNEEANIAETITKSLAVAKAIAPQYEIIVINDGSKDRTGEIAESFAKNNSFVRVVHHEKNKGYGAAVWSGIQAAQHEYIFYMDADLQFDPWEITKLTEWVPQYHAVLGYRADRKDPFMRILNAKGWHILNRIFFGLQFKDIDCAFKLFKRDLIKDLPIRSRGAMFSAELLLLLQKQGIEFKEIPVTHMPRVAGSPTGAKPKVIARAFKELMHVYWNN